MKEKMGMYQKTFSVNISSATKPLNPTDFPPSESLAPAAFPGCRNTYVALSDDSESGHAAFIDGIVSRVPRAQARTTA
ncbi:hypothetical protein B7R78_0008535 [Ralstonia solanacearum]|uniref:hypothetical protein n=1 Tax=Ralstonia solanacearum species complex TaxID=3116862 RepID=UPI00114042B7|nr:hypothetical protein [Ralstonia solanacearum]MBT1537172.1 hypothetical protein [Ralstonia solanacearum]QOK83197.1 hypothetical protein HF906_14180 [Ralstonia solanacearum]